MKKLKTDGDVSACGGRGGGGGGGGGGQGFFGVKQMWVLSKSNKAVLL